MAQFAELLLPLAIKGTYTYRIPEDMRTLLQIGCRVLVPFGQKKIYTAIVVLLHDNEPKGYRVKEIISMINASKQNNDLRELLRQTITVAMQGMALQPVAKKEEISESDLAALDFINSL